jgi:threonine/homoserine/homoserine lactone efflux protein
VRVKGPADEDLPLLNLRGEPATLLTQPGIYTAQASGGAAAKFAVNVVDPDVSNLARNTLASGGRSAIAVASGAAARPWWMYCLAIAFVAALLEWWTWLRRITV